MNTTMVAAESDSLVMEHFIELVHTYTLKQSHCKNPIYGYLKARIAKMWGQPVVKMWYDDGYRRYLKVIHPQDLMVTMDIGDFVKDKVESIVTYEMAQACRLDVPLVADCGWGNNWLEAH